MTNVQKTQTTQEQAILLIAEGLQTISIGLKELVGAVPSKEADVTTAKDEKNVPPINFEGKEEAEANAPEVVEEEGYTLEELNAMTVKQLKELADEHEIKYGDKIRKADLIDLIMDGAEEEVEPSVTAEINDETTVEEDTDEEGIDIETLSKDELISLIEENELGEVPAKKAKETVAKYEERLREFIYEVLSEDGDEEQAEAETEATDNDEVDSDDELTPQDLRDASLADLKELAKEYEVDVPAKITQAKLAELLIVELFDEDELEALEGEAEVEAENEEEEGISAEDLEEMSLSELKALADEYEVKYPKLIKAPKLREIIIAELFEDEGEDDNSDETDLDNDDRAKELGLDDMDVEELAELLTEHGISAKGKKEALVAKVLKAIDEGIIEVEEDEEEGK